MVVKRFAKTGLVAATLCLLPHTFAAVRAQGIEASIFGQVTDQGGLVLPGVTVTVTSPALQLRQIAVVTDDRGEYRLGSLPIGTYEITFGLEGFQTAKRAGRAADRRIYRKNRHRHGARCRQRDHHGGRHVSHRGCDLVDFPDDVNSRSA